MAESDSFYPAEVRIVASPRPGKNGAETARTWHLTVALADSADFLLHSGNVILMDAESVVAALPLHVSPAGDYRVRVYVNGRELPAPVRKGVD